MRDLERAENCNNQKVIVRQCRVKDTRSHGLEVVVGCQFKLQKPNALLLNESSQLVNESL